MTDKARAYHARVAAARKLPGHCKRCGKPNANGYAQCDRCRDYQSHYKKRLREQRFNVTVSPAQVERELAQMRRELSRLRATIKNMLSAYKRGYRMGYYAGLNGKRVRLRKTAWIPPMASKQELAAICHAYNNPDFCNGTAR